MQRQVSRHKSRQTKRQKDKQAYICTDRQEHRQTERQAGTQACMQAAGNFIQFSYGSFKNIVQLFFSLNKYIENWQSFVCTYATKIPIWKIVTTNSIEVSMILAYFSTTVWDKLIYSKFLKIGKGEVGILEIRFHI